MTHPGPDGRPSDDQPREPGSYGQQPGPHGEQPGTYGQAPGPYAAQPGQLGPYPAFGQPGQPGGAWVPPQGGATPAGQRESKGGALNKLLPVVGGVALIAALAVAFGLAGGGDPGVGDCVRNAAGEEVEVVDCDSEEAEVRIVGVDEQELDYADFMEQAVCTEFANATNALWVGQDQAEPGTIYCAEPV